MRGDQLIGDAQALFYEAESLVVKGGKKGLVRAGGVLSIRDEDVAGAMLRIMEAHLLLFRALRARGRSEIWIENAEEKARAEYRKARKK